ncbi:MAG: hypothetical protein R3D27_10855 [Hyphomicrobiaceae bacterium]
MNTAQARLTFFIRDTPGTNWRAVGNSRRAVVGASGLAWGNLFDKFKRSNEPSKHEGDRRSPAGFFKLGQSFGFGPSKLPDYIQVQAGDTVCVEDPSSKFYNMITRRSRLEPGIRADEMRANNSYRIGVFINYPTDRTHKRGSCMFVHLWRSPTRGTAGCIGLDEAGVAAVQKFARQGAVLGILPLPLPPHLGRCLLGAAGSIQPEN